MNFNNIVVLGYENIFMLSPTIVGEKYNVFGLSSCPVVRLSIVRPSVVR